MSDPLSSLPLRGTWLADIVQVLSHRPGGVAEVAAIAAAIARTDRDVGDEAESTIIRTINNYCSDARDTDCKAEHDLFERVAPGTYRLRSYPEAPDLVAIRHVEFEETIEGGTYSDYWAKLNEAGARQPKWRQMTRRQRLEVFSRAIGLGG